MIMIHLQFSVNNSSRFTSDSEANASESLVNLEEKYFQYYMHGVLYHTIVCYPSRKGYQKSDL